MAERQRKPVVVVAGAAGDLGGRIARALVANGISVRALARRRTNNSSTDGIDEIAADYGSRDALRSACVGAVCVVSALNGLDDAILGAQGELLEAAVSAGVPRFIPSDFCLDYTATRPGDNRNMDLRRAFMTRLDAAPIRSTSILNGPFADLLSGQAPIVLHRFKRVLFWGDPDQPFDFTTKDDVAAFTADAALDPEAPRFLRIAGDEVSPRGLAEILSEIDNRPWKLLRAGSIGRLSAIIGVVRFLTPTTDTPFPVWQGMQYLRDMSTGDGKLRHLDNGRYGKTDWTRAAAVLAPSL